MLCGVYPKLPKQRHFHRFHRLQPYHLLPLLTICPSRPPLHRQHHRFLRNKFETLFGVAHIQGRLTSSNACLPPPSPKRRSPFPPSPVHASVQPLEHPRGDGSLPHLGKSSSCLIRIWRGVMSSRSWILMRSLIHWRNDGLPLRRRTF